MSDLHGKRALITGASAGIGRETARTFAREGADVALAARREDRLEELAAELEDDHGVETLVVPTDVSEHEQVQSMVERTVETFGGLDVLVNNAGVAGYGSIDDITIEEYRTLMGVNVDGMFFATKAAVPHLRESRGNAIFVASFAGQYPRPGGSPYAASKWWTRGFALSLSGLVGTDDVAVTVINPAETRTDIGGETGDPMKAQYDPGETTEPETVADAIAFAASQSPPTVVNELDVYRRDKFSSF